MTRTVQGDGTGQPLSSMRMAEQVADILRRRILGSDLINGALLPKQDELVAEFGVSYPSVREALRILEAEGLISIRRGNQGGAQVHAPDAFTAGYAFGLSLQAMRVQLTDLAEALATIEPMCAARCARRPDRLRKVVPRLRQLLKDAEAVKDDEVAFTQAGRAFHDAIMDMDDNATERLIVRSLGALWDVQEQDWLERVTRDGRGSERRDPHAVLEVHQSVVDLIEDGNDAVVEEVMREHVRFLQRRVLGSSPTGIVDAASPRTRARLRALARDAQSSR